MKDDSHYRKIGFKCGLEIHQRLATDRKLFCECLSDINASDKSIGHVTRKQRAVAGELGSIDRSAEFEEGKDRTFKYHIFRDRTCLVDIDEEPPHGINMQAFMVALSLSQAMGMKPVDEAQPMRKEVVDGSDPSAFQRSVLVALNGQIKVGSASVGVPSLFIEEESSGIEREEGNLISYNTDRLGIPLIEIDTDPTIPTAKAAKEIALYIGTLIRVSGMAQRGIGSIRQDVNVSISGGARVEIKGLQEIDTMDRFIDNEIDRQENLIRIRDTLVKRKASVGRPKNVTRAFANTKSKVLRSSLDADGRVMAIPLHGFKGLLGTEVNPNRRLGSEISDYAKTAGVHGIIHSDEDIASYSITKEELAHMRKELSITEHDSFIIVGGKEGQAEKAASRSAWRASQAMVGIPVETRGVNNVELCTTRFLRPLPGGSRMYPETDAHPIPIHSMLMEQAAGSAPSIEKEREFLGAKLTNKAYAEQLLTSPRLQLFKAVTTKTNVEPNFAASVILQKLTELGRQGVNVSSIREDRILEMFREYDMERITKQAIDEILKSLGREDEPVDSIIKKHSLSRMHRHEISALVAQAEKEGKADANAIRKELMSKYRLRIDGEELNSILASKVS
ncbi:MAG: Glu-tRNA(Gln) amidotransferase subunit GatE [Candidatus Micrarchaeota archaeon]|nr:Glu-tRNA(Gln) amidotransferase subunit GatE [Candidatus Micrarchaeota archaeon]